MRKRKKERRRKRITTPGDCANEQQNVVDGKIKREDEEMAESQLGL